MQMRRLNQKAIDWIMIWGITVFASLPLMVGGIHRGHDIGFHLLRIEGIAEELRRLQFPVRMQSLWMDGYGYPVSIYYGDLLLYIPAVFRLLGFSLIVTYKIYIFFINAVTTANAYFCFEKIWNNRQIAMMTSLAYVTSGYRMVDIYVRAAVGEYSAMVFFPFIALSVYRVYTSKGDDKKEGYKNAFLLCLGMTGLIETHILSTEMTILILLLICIVLWKRTFRKKILLIYLLAIAEVLILNLYFIVPFLDYYCNVWANINVVTDATQVNRIQSAGAYWSQYVSFFHNIFGFSSVNISERMQLSPGPLLMFAPVLGIIVYIKNGNKRTLFYMEFALLMLFFSSNIFPWNFLAEEFAVGNILTQIQFPWRYLSFAILFLALLLGESLKELFLMSQQKMGKWLVAAFSTGILMTCCFIGNYVRGAERIYSYEIEGTNTCEIGAGEEYLLAGSNIGILSNEISGTVKEVNLVFRDGTYMELFVIVGDEPGSVELPLFAYKGYCVVDEWGVEYKVGTGSNNRLQFELPAGYMGKIYVNFQSPWYWKVAEIISAVVVVSVLIFASRYVKRYRKTES